MRMTLTTLPMASAGRFSPSGPVDIFPPSVSTQHTFQKADLLGDDVNGLFSRQRLGNWSPGINRF
jgi:hypothetical protein